MHTQNKRTEQPARLFRARAKALIWKQIVPRHGLFPDSADKCRASASVSRSNRLGGQHRNEIGEMTKTASARTHARHFLMVTRRNRALVSHCRPFWPRGQKETARTVLADEVALMARACLLPERAEEAGLDCTVQRCHAHHRTATDTDCLHNSSSSQLSVSKRQLRQKRNLPPCPNKSNDDRVQQSFHSNLLCCLAEGSALFRSINFAPNNGRVIRLK